MTGGTSQNLVTNTQQRTSVCTYRGWSWVKKLCLSAVGIFHPTVNASSSHGLTSKFLMRWNFPLQFNFNLPLLFPLPTLFTHTVLAALCASLYKTNNIQIYAPLIASLDLLQTLASLETAPHSHRSGSSTTSDSRAALTTIHSSLQTPLRARKVIKYVRNAPGSG